ncbi:MAG: Dph6-related ATP pyrophosphatase [Candidatus Dormibacteraceae bacterium]
MTGRPHALMWSGGKDSALALDRARRVGIEVTRLVSLYDSATRRVRFHATRVEMLEAQAAAIGIDLHPVPTTWPDMEVTLHRELSSLKAEGFTGVVFGDIHLADVRAWYEVRVRAAGLEHVEPIWGEPPQTLLDEFTASGGRAVLTCVELARLDEPWLGRVTDEAFASEIGNTGADPCGENGEYHSFAFAGPVFTHPVRWFAAERRFDAGFVQLDLTGEPGNLSASRLIRGPLRASQ